MSINNSKSRLHDILLQQADWVGSLPLVGLHYEFVFFGEATIGYRQSYVLEKLQRGLEASGTAFSSMPL